MTYATLLLHLGDGHRIATHVALAARLARRFESHVVGLSASGGRIGDPLAIVGGLGSMPVSAWDDLQRAAEARGARFVAEAREQGIPDFEVVVDDVDASTALLRRGRCADLVMIGQPEPGLESFPAQRSLLQHAILGLAAPCLVVPYAGDFADTGSTVLVAWNDSRECARAILAAMPLLQRAATVHLLQLEAPPEPGGRVSSSTLDGAAAWLRRHGAPVRASVEPSEIDFGNALLSRASDLGADLIVAGAWSHSRVGESLFGGVTQTLLESMTVPLLTAR